MKKLFDLTGKKSAGKRNRSYKREWDETEFEYEEIEEEDSEGVYDDGEYAEEYADEEEEYDREEYADDEDFAEAYVDEEYGDAEDSAEVYADEEYGDAENFGEVYVEEEYTDDEDSAEVYAEEEYGDAEDSAEAYTGEEYAEDEYADEENAEEFLAAALLSEGAEEEYQEQNFEEISYEEEDYIADDYQEEYTVGTSAENAEEYYEYEEGDEEDEEEEKKGLLLLFSNADIIDKLVMFSSIAVALVVLIVGGIYVGTKLLAKEEGNPLQEVGLQLGQIDTIGAEGLLAVSDAQKAALEAAQIVEEEKNEEETEYEETEYKTEVTVSLSLSSIEKDLKIKFINKDTGKLVGNVPFSITITDPDGKESLWSDDDMDGIIYKKNLAAGQYKIDVNAFEDAKYKKYGLPEEQKKVQVKETIEYNKVDVSNEVKTESQVNVQQEDTKKNETVVESYLSDTVAWVESTTTLVSYTEVDKSNIVNPMPAVASVDSAAVSVASAAGTETAAAAGTEAAAAATSTTSATATTTTTTNPTVSGGDVVVPDPMVITLDKKETAVYADYTGTVTVSVENLMENAVITAETSDMSVATVQISDKTITITGVTAGTANITVNCSAEVKETVTGTDGTAETTKTYKAEPVVCIVTVKANPQKDTVTVLKDNLDREVYVKDGDTYRPAYSADYFTYSKFYVKGAAKYTGWQTMGGNRYYYDASGKAVTGEQVIQGVKYNFASDGVLVTGSGTLGIDVSKWNGNIDWTAVKNSGVSYVIIRCGYRGSSQGALIKDSKFETNIQGAINAGLKVGVYFFTQAIDKSEALEEASMVLDCIKNYSISYPIFLDVEPSGGRADGLDAATRTEICKTFCETIQNYGYTAGIYANKTWLNEKINTSELSSSYKIWLAQYASEPTYSGRYDMWQYKSTGTIDGISGDVDMNLSYLGN